MNLMLSNLVRTCIENVLLKSSILYIKVVLFLTSDLAERKNRMENYLIFLELTLDKNLC